MRAIDMHVHLPTADWVCGCVGDYLDSVERYFGRGGVVDDGDVEHPLRVAPKAMIVKTGIVVGDSD
jgi:hypothetical protein